MGEVVEALEGSSSLHGCVMGFSNCGTDNPCPLHPAWGQVKAQMASSMTQVTIQDLRRLNTRSKPLAKRGEA